MSEDKPISLQERKGHKQRAPFVPMTGNPENGNYLDYYHHLQEQSQVVPFTAPPADKA